LAGISEILVLILLIACIIILPRLFKKEPSLKKSVKKPWKLSVKIRLGIVFSILYPIAMALYIKPWNDNLISFISYGIIPVLLVWAVTWIIAGLKK